MPFRLKLASVWMPPLLLWFTTLQAFSIIVLAAEQQEDTCRTFKEEGKCYDKLADITNLSADGIGDAIVASGSKVAESIYEQFVEPLIEIAMEVALYETNLSGFCFGDFKGIDFGDNDQLDQLGCSAIPVTEEVSFGTVAGKISIPPLLQDALVPLALWKGVKKETVTPNFCMGIRVPTKTCDDFTFGMSIDDGAIETLSGVLPAAGAGDALMAFVTALKQKGENPVTFAMSLGDGLDVPVKYYVDRTFVKDNFHAHLFFGYAGPIDLPMVSGNEKDIVKVTGKYKRGFNLGKTPLVVKETVAGLLDSSKLSGQKINSDDAMKYMESILSTFPEVITTSEPIVVDLDGVTKGLLKGFKISGTIIQALKLPKKVRDVHPGFYMSALVEMGILKEIVKGLCDDMSGALRAVSGKGCPNLEDGLLKSGKLGLELRKAVAELSIEWEDFFLRCRVGDMNTEQPEMSCQINSVVVGIRSTKDGYKIGKAAALTGKVEEKVTETSKASVKAAEGFGKKLSSSVKLSAESSDKLFVSVSKFFGSKVGDKREDVSFNFEEKTKCKDSIRLWSSRDPRDFKGHFKEAGNDDSKANCFESCFLWSQKNPQSKGGDMCCSYEVMGMRGKKPKAECRVGGNGREKTSDKRKSATGSFVDDYNQMTNLPSVGARCSRDEQCFTGFCHDGNCKNECDKKSKCFPSSWSKCFGDDDACINVDGTPHFCDKKSDSCKCDDSSKRCGQNVLPEVSIDLLGGDMKLSKKQKKALKRIKNIATTGTNKG